MPALIRKFHNAKVKNFPCVECWGSGKPMREFLYVDDLADACIFLMDNYNDTDIINIGYGSDISIKCLASIIAEVIGYHGKIIWDQTKPDGTPRKLLDCGKINNLGWHPSVSLEKGIELTYQWFIKNYAN